MIGRVHRQAPPSRAGSSTQTRTPPLVPATGNSSPEPRLTPRLAKVLTNPGPRLALSSGGQLRLWQQDWSFSRGRPRPPQNLKRQAGRPHKSDHAPGTRYASIIGRSRPLGNCTALDWSSPLQVMFGILDAHPVDGHSSSRPGVGLQTGPRPRPAKNPSTGSGHFLVKPLSLSHWKD